MNEYIITNIGMIVAIIISIILLIGMFKQSNKTYKDKTTKPWGEEEVLYNEELVDIYDDDVFSNSAKVKILRIKANQSLSKQYHNFKREMLVCLKGHGGFEMNGITKTYQRGFNIFVDIRDIHKIIACSDSKFIELSYGNDSDIIRVEDEYGRK